MDRRSFIHGSAAALAGSALPLFPMAAMAADEIVVGSIIDMSGGLDIYGKPMADCMTLAKNRTRQAACSARRSSSPRTTRNRTCSSTRSSRNSRR
jgi:hypothetical protein